MSEADDAPARGLRRDAARDETHRLGAAIELAGGELTMTEVAEVFARVVGRPVRYERISVERFSENIRATTGSELDADHIRMLGWFDEGGFRADLTALRAEYPAMTTLEQFVRRRRVFL